MTDGDELAELLGFRRRNPLTPAEWEEQRRGFAFGDVKSNAAANEKVEGVKHDAEKRQWSLLPWPQIAHVVDVLVFGAKKYAIDNWQRVPDPKRRYFDAAIRHFTAWQEGELLDSESKLPHLAHAVCCALFLIWFDDQEAKRG